jgi:predicted regulator of Ras-like GTPase activity (Roadblock/LC7/MglB family)
MTDDDGIRAELLTLRGCERVVRGTPDDRDSDPIAVRLRLLAALAMRTSDALELGEPRLLTVSYDDRMVALAIEPGGGILAVITSDPSAVGLAMVKLRYWLSTRARGGP